MRAFRVPSGAAARLGALVALAALAGAPGVLAQSVRGQLVDQANGVAISGAFVVLVDQGEREVARGLTDEAGAFLLRAPGPGTYRLQSRRIGFRMTASPPFSLAAGQTLTYRLTVAAVPAELPPVVVEGRPQCGTSGEAGTVVAQLWEDTREALAAVKWTQKQHWYAYSVDLYDRDLDADARRVRRQRTWTSTGASETPFRSIPAESLATVGYVVGDDHEGRTFYGPDPDVLLSDTFLDSHCFTARQGAGADSGLVGLAFAPAPGRRLADVQGVLWVSRRSAELRKLEFTYVNLPPSLLQGTSGGSEDFLRLQTGAWVILRWVIRMPLVSEVVDPSGRIAPHFTVRGYHETGGQVSTIRSPGGALVYAGEQAILDGVVVDSSRGGRPLAGALVALAGTPYAARADSAGHFQLSAPVEGLYGVVFSHPRLDSLGGLLAPRSVTLTRGGRATITLVVPAESLAISQLCPEGVADSERVIIGVVTHGPRGARAPGAAVHATWQVFGGGQGRLTAQPWTASVAADSAGHYVLCGVPAVRVTLRADAGTAKSHPVLLRFGAGGVWIDERLFHSIQGRIWMEDLVLVP
jgi:Carboxypeptidase regulatory-like domain